MRITESRLRRIIREALNEDLAGFMDKTKDISYKGFVQDPTFDLDWNKKNKAAARSVKQIWAAEADHKFMSNAIKIHWLKKAGLQEKLQALLSMSGKNEISTMGYLPGTETFMSNWGPIGVVVQGRTTLAANRMSTLLSGYGERLSPEITGKYAASGTPKRATFFAGTAARGETSLADEYILDQASFSPAGQGGNEFIVGNWRPIGIALAKPFADIMIAQALGETVPRVTPEEVGGYLAAAESTGLPWTSEEDAYRARFWKSTAGSSQQVNESAGGIPWREQAFSDGRGSWNVGLLHDYAQKRHKLQDIPISDLEGNNLDSDEQVTTDANHEEFVARAMRSDVTKPIIVVSYPDGLWCADGTHRLWKARHLLQRGLREDPTIRGWILDWEELTDIPHGPPQPESLTSPY